MQRRIWERECGLDGGPRQFRNSTLSAPGLYKRLALENLLRGHTGCVNHVTFNETGDLLASGSDDWCVHLWDTAARKRKGTWNTGHTQNVFCVKFMPETGNRLIATCAGDGEVRVHSLETEQTKAFDHHENRVKKLVTEPGNPNLLLSCGEDGTVRQLDLRDSDNRNANILVDLHNVHLLRCEVHSISSPKLKPWLLALGSGDETLRIYDRRMLVPVSEANREDNRTPQRCLMTYDLCESLTECITGVCFSDNGEEVLANFLGDYVYLFPVESRSTEKKTFKTQQGRRRVRIARPRSTEDASMHAIRQNDEGTEVVTDLDGILGLIESCEVSVARRRRRSVSNAFVERGEALLDEGNLEEALRFARAAARLCPVRGYTHYTVARCLERMGQYEEALNAVNEALCVSWSEQLDEMRRNLTLRTSAPQQHSSSHQNDTEATVNTADTPNPDPPHDDHIPHSNTDPQVSHEENQHNLNHQNDQMNELDKLDESDRAGPSTQGNAGDLTADKQEQGGSDGAKESEDEYSWGPEVSGRNSENRYPPPAPLHSPPMDTPIYPYSPPTPSEGNNNRFTNPPMSPLYSPRVPSDVVHNRLGSSGGDDEHGSVNEGVVGPSEHASVHSNGVGVGNEGGGGIEDLSGGVLERPNRIVDNGVAATRLFGGGSDSEGHCEAQNRGSTGSVPELELEESVGAPKSDSILRTDSEGVLNSARSDQGDDMDLEEGIVAAQEDEGDSSPDGLDEFVGDDAGMADVWFTLEVDSDFSPSYSGLAADSSFSQEGFGARETYDWGDIWSPSDSENGSDNEIDDQDNDGDDSEGGVGDNGSDEGENGVDPWCALGALLAQGESSCRVQGRAWLNKYRGHVHLRTIKDVTFVGPDENIVGAGSDDGRMFLWEKNSGKLISALRADRHTVNCIASHPTNLMVASCGIDDTVKVWTPCLSSPRKFKPKLYRSLTYNEMQRRGGALLPTVGRMFSRHHVTQVYQEMTAGIGESGASSNEGSG